MLNRKYAERTNKLINLSLKMAEETFDTTGTPTFSDDCVKDFVSLSLIQKKVVCNTLKRLVEVKHCEESLLLL